MHGADRRVAMDAAGQVCIRANARCASPMGPDEVHWMVVGRSELASYEGLEVPASPTSAAMGPVG